MSDFDQYFKSILPLLDERYKTLAASLSAGEQKSMQAYVTPQNIGRILSWIGSDQEIQDLLFWDKGGKFDDPAWQALQAADEPSARLYTEALSAFTDMQAQSVAIQRKSDLTLYSQFNDALLFTGLAGAVWCKDGFTGVEFRCIGSVAEALLSISIMPVEAGYSVQFGSWQQGAGTGIPVYSGDSYCLLQLAQLVDKQMPKIQFTAWLQDEQGQRVELDPKAIRKVASEGGKLHIPSGLRMFAQKNLPTPGEAVEAAAQLMQSFYSRVGIEAEAYSISRLVPNFGIMREENFKDIFKESAQAKGLVLLTATNICRRCRREISCFYEYARQFPDVRFTLVNLSSPQFEFYERVFGDMGGGNPDEFRKNAVGVTPFIIFYKSAAQGLEYVKYTATGKDENVPDKKAVLAECAEIFGK